MVVRNTYQPIDPIEPDFPTDGPQIGRTGPPAPPRGVRRSPQCKSFHAFTKWLGQGRPIGHAQQTGAPVRRDAGADPAKPLPRSPHTLNALRIKGASGSYRGVEIAPDR